ASRAAARADGAGDRRRDAAGDQARLGGAVRRAARPDVPAGLRAACRAGRAGGNAVRPDAAVSVWRGMKNAGGMKNAECRMQKVIRTSEFFLHSAFRIPHSSFCLLTAP